MGEIEDINKQHEENQKPDTESILKNNQGYMKDQEEKRKREILGQMIRAEIKEQMQIIQNEIPNVVQMTIAQIIQEQNQQAQQQQQQKAPISNNLQDLDPATKGKILSEVGTSFAQIIQAWKSGQPQNQGNDMYGEMFKQMGLDIVQAGLDGIKQQIYPQFVPQPRNVNYQIPQRPQQQNQSTGFR